jgi:hypothetical protein
MVQNATKKILELLRQFNLFIVQGDQKVSVHLMFTVQKDAK